MGWIREQRVVGESAILLRMEVWTDTRGGRERREGKAKRVKEEGGKEREGDMQLSEGRAF